MRATGRDIRAANRLYRRKRYTEWFIIVCALLWAFVLIFMLWEMNA